MTMHSVVLDPREVSDIRRLLGLIEFKQQPTAALQARKLAEELAVRSKRSELYGFYTGEARDQQTSDLEVDEQPDVSESDDGAWVSAWMWVAAPEKEEQES